MLEGPETRVVFLGFDQERNELLEFNVKGKNPFKDKRVREAIHRSIDVEAIKRTRDARPVASRPPSWWRRASTATRRSSTSGRPS